LLKRNPVLIAFGGSLLKRNPVLIAFGGSLLKRNPVLIAFGGSLLKRNPVLIAFGGLLLKRNPILITFRYRSSPVLRKRVLLSEIAPCYRDQHRPLLDALFHFVSNVHGPLLACRSRSW
jgi:hypothetical protein